MRRQQDSLSSQFVSWQRCGGGLNSAHSRVGLYDCAARFSKAVHSCQQHSASIWTLFKSMCSYINSCADGIALGSSIVLMQARMAGLVG
jgi:hypothetical protein